MAGEHLSRATSILRASRALGAVLVLVRQVDDDMLLMDIFIMDSLVTTRRTGPTSVKVVFIVRRYC